MGMKLLSPFASKDQQQEEISRKLLRSQEVEKLAVQANARLARAESDFALALAKSKETWATHIEEQQKINTQLESETLALERRKEQALIPIQMYKDEADKIVKDAQLLFKKVKEREEQADYLQEKLENKLTELSDRENMLIDGEQRLVVAKQGLQSQLEATKQGTKLLSEQMVTFHMKQQEDEASITERKKEVTLAEISFNAKLEKYKRDLEAMKIWESQLNDQRETLKRAMERIK